MNLFILKKLIFEIQNILILYIVVFTYKIVIEYKSDIPEMVGIVFYKRFILYIKYFLKIF